MAAVVGLVGKWNTTTGTHTATGTSVTGDLIVIFCANSDITGAPTVTDNDTSGTYTQVGTGALLNASVDKMFCFVRDARVASGKSTIYSATGASSTGGGLFVYRVTGMSVAGLTAVRQSAKQENQAAGTPAPVLGSAANTANPLICAVVTLTNGTANCAARSSPAWTEDSDVGYNTPPHGLELQHIDSGETGTTLTLGAATPSGFACIVVELNAPDRTVTPSQVAAVAAVPAPTVTITQDASVAPTQVAAVAAVPAPSITLLTSVAPSQVAAVVAVPAPTVSVSVNVTPNTVAAVAAMPAPTESGSANVTADTVAAIASAPAPAETGAANITVTQVAAPAAVPTPTLSGSASVEPSTVAASVAVPAPAVTGDANVNPSEVALLASIPAPTVETAVDVEVTPATVAAVVTVPAPSVSATADANVAPATVAAAVAVPAPSVTITQPPVIVATVHIMPQTFWGDIGGIEWRR